MQWWCISALLLGRNQDSLIALEEADKLLYICATIGNRNWSLQTITSSFFSENDYYEGFAHHMEPCQGAEVRGGLLNPIDSHVDIPSQPKGFTLGHVARTHDQVET